MATTITNYSKLRLLAGFVDEDDRTITLENPRDNITESDIQSLPADGVLIGDKYGAEFSRFKSAAYVRGTTTNMTF